MDPHELIKADLGITNFRDEMMSVYDGGMPPIFPSHKLFVVRGYDDRFDFVSLPTGSYTYYAVTHDSAIRLTRDGKEIESVIEREWNAIPAVDIVEFTQFVLQFYEDGIKRSHHVLRDVHDLRSMQGEHRILNAKAISQIANQVGETQLCSGDDQYQIRAVTLCGWMHEKQELGIESVSITNHGEVSLGARQILCRKTFLKLPAIMY